jgi:hypothetical protein
VKILDSTFGFVLYLGKITSDFFLLRHPIWRKQLQGHTLKKILILIVFLTTTGCSELVSYGIISDTALMNAEERAEHDRLERQKAAEAKRQRVERYRRETGGQCETKTCYSAYKLRISFEETCKNYGHRQDTAAFNQCVGMEINNYEREQQLKQMEAASIARDRQVARDAYNRQVRIYNKNQQCKFDKFIGVPCSR